MRQREHDVYTPTTARAAAATGMAAQPRPEVRALQAQQPVQAVTDRNCTVRSQGIRQVVCRRGVGKGMRSIAVLGRTSSFYCRSFCIHRGLLCGMGMSSAGRLRSASHALTRRSDGLPLSREAHTRAEVSASCVSAHHAWHHVLPCCGRCGLICGLKCPTSSDHLIDNISIFSPESTRRQSAVSNTLNRAGPRGMALVGTRALVA